MTPVEIAVVALLAGSVFFAFVAVVGVLRLPDLYTRAHAASKSDTLGAVLGLAAVAAVYGAGIPTVKAVFLLVFMFVTNPTAAHAIARAAFDQDIEPWTGEAADRTGRGVDADRSPEDVDGSESLATDGGPAPETNPRDGSSTGGDR
ncbi:Na+/H+ antiporter subunit G [Haloprofundus sp. MHR1]|nr:Na+/H+ antiporter subunit G [Haloprofundus sp. MHR1]